MQRSSHGPELKATDREDRKGLLYEATLFVNTWERTVGMLRLASVHASCSPSPESSPLPCSPLQSLLETVDYETMVLLGLEGCLLA